ncbi:hypothetical protein ACRAKI_23385 [Saccharothrix isguenensis]
MARAAAEAAESTEGEVRLRKVRELARKEPSPGDQGWATHVRQPQDVPRPALRQPLRHEPRLRRRPDPRTARAGGVRGLGPGAPNQSLRSRYANGRYRVGAGFPTEHYTGNHYWVDVDVTQ